MTTYALNGLGRIGKLALKPLLDRGAEIAWINDAVGDPEMHAHLLEFDTVHGRWQADFAHDQRQGAVIVGKQRRKTLPWTDLRLPDDQRGGEQHQDQPGKAKHQAGHGRGSIRRRSSASVSIARSTWGVPQTQSASRICPAPLWAARARTTGWVRISSAREGCA